MYVRTPKRYRGTMRRNVLPLRRIFFWVVMLFVIVLGVGLYQNSDLFTPIISEAVEGVFNQVGESVSTMMAPTPTPTQDPTNILIQASNFWDQGAIADAIALYQQAAPSLPNEEEIFDRVAMGLIMMGQEEQALTYAEQAVNANPFSADAWAIRSWALDWNSLHGEAIASALHALEIEPENARAMAFLAEAYYGAGQTQRALTTANEAVQADPNSAEAYRARGLIQWGGLFDLEAAIADFQQAVALMPNLSIAAMDMAVIEDFRNNDEAAADILQDVIELNPGNSGALLQLGLLYFGSFGDFSQSASYFTRCIDVDSTNARCHYWLGRAQNSLDQPTLAAESFAAAIAFGSTDPYHYWWAGNSQLNIGNCNRARSYLQSGYQIALQGTDANIISDFEFTLSTNQCLSSGGSLLPTPTLLPTPEPGGI